MKVHHAPSQPRELAFVALVIYIKIYQKHKDRNLQNLDIFYLPVRNYFLKAKGTN